MKRKFTVYPVQSFNQTKIQMLNWAEQFNIFCFLDNHNYKSSTSSFECLLAAGSSKELKLPVGKAFAELQNFSEANNDWIFGHLSYDLKNEIENLTSTNPEHVKFPDIFFFVPKVVIILTKHEFKIGVTDLQAEKIFGEVNASPVQIAPRKLKVPQISSRFTREEYLGCVQKLQKHILRGDCYEINFCQEFFAHDAEIYPLGVYEKLSFLSPNPFCALYKQEHNYLLCASPERFLKKDGSKIFSQPIKGTSKRELNDHIEDENNRFNLLNSEKERAENVMIVDLVRNDLSKICVEGSVKVEELFGIYSFPQVHQMISTVSGQLKNEGESMANILRATFPMGSMTGAPKKKVMELIETYEKSKRGLFSGALGYIKPNHDFDFNVVIRSILYNSKDKNLSMQAGSAITFNSDAEKEYEECLLKIDAMKKVLQ